MDRRTFLATTSAVSLAGCADFGGERVPQTSDSAAEPIEISINQDTWVSDGGAVSFLLSNQDETRDASVSATIQWFDASGRYLGQDSSSLPALSAGSTWFTAIESTAPFEAESYEISAEGTEITGGSSSAVKIISYELNDNQLTVTGEAANNRNEQRGITVAAAIYDGPYIMSAGWVTDENVPANTTWRFLIPLSNVDFEDSQVGDDVEIYVI